MPPGEFRHRQRSVTHCKRSVSVIDLADSMTQNEVLMRYSL